MNPRAIVVAAPASGSGKTTIATGLIGALRDRGVRVAPFKVGPDYIDPGYHALAAGRPGRNLDPVLVGTRRIGPLVLHGARGTEIAIVEGVMGLFDGRLADGHGSTAQVALALEAPVLLVVDCRGQAQTLAAVLRGFRDHDPAVRLAGVVLNRVGGERHEQVLRAAAAAVDLPVFGAVPRHAELTVPSRHLGLVTAAEHGVAAVSAVRAMTALVSRHVDLDAVLRAAQPIPTGVPWDPGVEVGEPVSGRPVVAVAGGSAFTFGYAEHLELLEAAGAVVRVVDPLRDEALPEGTAALVLPGGFPEEHGSELAANEPLRTAVRALAASGAPIHAECAGLLYLCRDLDGHPMCGVLPVSGAMSERLTLGYRDAVAAADSVLFARGEQVAGHEFHRCSVTERAGEMAAWACSGAASEGFVQGGVHASFLHLHPAGGPGAVARFVAAAVSSL